MEGTVRILLCRRTWSAERDVHLAPASDLIRAGLNPLDKLWPC